MQKIILVPNITFGGDLQSSPLHPLVIGKLSISDLVKFKELIGLTP
jgi:hypothetical protein